MSGVEVLEAALAELRPLGGGERVHEHRVVRGGLARRGDEAALLRELGERVAAPRGVEQVGGDHRVVGEGLGHPAQRLGVVGDHRPLRARRDELGGVAAPRRRAPPRRPRRRRSPSLRRGEQRALGRLRGAGGEREVAVVQRGGVRRTARPKADREGRLAGRARRRRLLAAQRLLEAPQRVAQLELAEHVAQTRAIGLGADEGPRLEVGRDVAAGGRELLRHPRVLGVLAEDLLALGAGDLVDVVEHVLERPEPLEQLGRGLVADAGDPGDVVGGVALQADEVGHQLRRDAVAVDHPVAVVDPGVGDPARGRHDPHAVVDQLVGVAVAGDDHHRHALPPRALGDRGDHVVGLVALDGEVAVAERLDQRLEVRPLLLEQVRARGALRLVLGIDLAAARVPGVPHDDRRLRRRSR